LRRAPAKIANRLCSIRDPEEGGAPWQRGQRDALDASGVNCDHRRRALCLRSEREREESAESEALQRAWAAQDHGIHCRLIARAENIQLLRK